MADFSSRQWNVIEHLARGETVVHTSQQTGTSERTIFRWQACLPGFKAAVTQRRAAMVESAAALLSASMSEAAVTLRELLGSATDSTRLQAAKSILELATKLRESTEISSRIEALEQLLHEHNSPKT